MWRSYGITVLKGSIDVHQRLVCRSNAILQMDRLRLLLIGDKFLSAFQFPDERIDSLFQIIILHLICGRYLHRITPFVRFAVQ